ncbi:hypothetical protein PGTUg99_011366 [Puccinia graminis f. sp. tritici]|uniref:Uncharacterized protein n=1 Tax=Puccinia graminis f. sp. tritici TaxID=56615 RepID=A0A5B0RQT0_PUCGR|nr:hypothetical protein PGTUg99_011366 [Puccinia graminis f. sp. tritici]
MGPSSPGPKTKASSPMANPATKGLSQSSTQSGNNTIARNDFATPVASSSGSSFRPQSPRESLDSDPVLGAGLTEKGKNRAVDLAPALKKRRGAAGANS